MVSVRAIYLAILILVFPTLALGQAAQYVGEFCWQFTQPGDPDFAVATLGITREGDDHFAVNGRVTSTEGGVEEDTTPANGNLELIDGEIVMTITLTENEPGFLFGNTIALVQLDSGTLDGTFQAVTILYDLIGGSFEVEYGAGIATFLPGCVVP